MGRIIQNYGKMKNVPNHQPVYIYIDIKGYIYTYIYIYIMDIWDIYIYL